MTTCLGCRVYYYSVIPKLKFSPFLCICEVTLPMCLLFSIISSSCYEGVVCYQLNHEWLKTETFWNFIQYVTLIYNHKEYHSFKDWCVYYLFYSYLHSNIKSHQSNQTRSTTLRNFFCCQYSYFCCWHSMTCNACICIIYVA
jgi:hypothetical protein